MEVVEENPSQYTFGICRVPREGKQANQSTKKVTGWGGRQHFRWVLREGLSERVMCEPRPEK